jgi:hypothetical protein
VSSLRSHLLLTVVVRTMPMTSRGQCAPRSRPVSPGAVRPIRPVEINHLHCQLQKAMPSLSQSIPQDPFDPLVVFFRDLAGGESPLEHLPGRIGSAT